MNKIIAEQLRKVKEIDVDNLHFEEGKCFIPQKKTIKIEEDCCYKIFLMPTLFVNTALGTNWNGGSYPLKNYLKVDVIKNMGKMIKVTGVAYDPSTGGNINYFWSGWLTVQDIQIIEKI